MHDGLLPLVSYCFAGLASEFMKDIITLRVGNGELIANPNIKQIVDVCSGYEKITKLRDFINSTAQKEQKKTLVFSGTKMNCEHLRGMLQSSG